MSQEKNSIWLDLADAAAADGFDLAREAAREAWAAGEVLAALGDALSPGRSAPPRPVDPLERLRERQAEERRASEVLRLFDQVSKLDGETRILLALCPGLFG